MLALFIDDPPEYGWVCGPNAYLAHLYAQVQFFGVLLGTLVFGLLSDKFGRKPAGVFSLTLGLAALFFSAFAPSWQLLLAARFVVGFTIGGKIVAIYTLAVEYLLPSQRMPLRAFCNWGGLAENCPTEIFRLRPPGDDGRVLALP